MKFRVYSKAPDAGWASDWYWAPATGGSNSEHGPFPFKLWAWVAGAFASLTGGVR